MFKKEREKYNKLITSNFVEVEKIQQDNYETIPVQYATDYIDSAKEITRNSIKEKNDGVTVPQKYCITCKDYTNKFVYIIIKNNTNDKYFLKYYFLNKIYYFDDLIDFINSKRVHPLRVIKGDNIEIADCESEFIIDKNKITISNIPQSIIERKNMLFYRYTYEYISFSQFEKCIYIFTKDNNEIKICFSWQY